MGEGKIRAHLVLAVLAGVAVLAPRAAPAVVIPLVADIESSQEVPADTGSLAFGVGVFEYDDVTHMFTWEILITSSLLEGAEIAAHIHGPAPVGIDASPLITLSLGAHKTDSVDITTVAGANEADLLDSLWYVNVHTDAFPDGEIRGQIIPSDVFPEPGSLALAVVGGLVLLRRRRS
jgi:uncharacterized protein (TIGR03382 family)